MSGQTEVLGRICTERARQDEKWGVQDHSDVQWMSILAEEVGEVAKEVNEYCPLPEVQIDGMRRELVHVAAVAVAWLECIDRRDAEPAGDPRLTLVTWDCECGRAVGGAALACPYCGKDRPPAAEPAGQPCDNWVCGCSVENDVRDDRCKFCGVQRLITSDNGS